MAEGGDGEGGGQVPSVVREAGERKLAVKMIRKGRDDLPGSDVERLIMWEVHSLRELAPHRATFNTTFRLCNQVHVLRELGLHPHIVQVTDVIDLQDCTYIVMERIDGPELPAHVTSQPAGRLPPAEARHLCTAAARSPALPRAVADPSLGARDLRAAFARARARTSVRICSLRRQAR